MAPRHRKDSAQKARELKDRLIQTRVPEHLESTLKEEAQKRRLSVSHLIRNMLEDAFEVVESVVTGAERIAETSVELADQVARDAGRIRETVRNVTADMREKRVEKPPEPASRIPEDVLGWTALVAHKPAHCVSCEREIERGENAHLGVKAVPSLTPTWLCEDCFEAFTSTEG